MKIRELKELLSAELMTDDTTLLDGEVFNACCSDMMSEQVVRTASMMDMVCIVFVRDKTPTPDMIRLAEDCDIVVMKSAYRAYEACGKLYTSGLVAREHHN